MRTYKFFDYLEPDLPAETIRQLLQYIHRLLDNDYGGIPVEGRMDDLRFCASRFDSAIRVHWVQIGPQRIPVDATV